MNWIQYLVSAGTFTASLIAIATYLDIRSRNRQNTIKTEIQESIDHLSSILLEKLETKENVAQLRIELARISEQVKFLSTAQWSRQTPLSLPACYETAAVLLPTEGPGAIGCAYSTNRSGRGPKMNASRIWNIEITVNGSPVGSPIQATGWDVLSKLAAIRAILPAGWACEAYPVIDPRGIGQLI